MPKIPVSISLDKDLKERATRILEAKGTDLSSACSLFLQKVIEERAIPSPILDGNLPPMTFSICGHPLQNSLCSMLSRYVNTFGPADLSGDENLLKMLDIFCCVSVGDVFDTDFDFVKALTEWAFDMSEDDVGAAIAEDYMPSSCNRIELNPTANTSVYLSPYMSKIITAAFDLGGEELNEKDAFTMLEYGACYLETAAMERIKRCLRYGIQPNETLIYQEEIRIFTEARQIRLMLPDNSLAPSYLPEFRAGSSINNSSGRAAAPFVNRSAIE